MHLLMTTDTIGGVWAYTRELVPALLRRGIRVTLVSFGEIPSTDQVQWMDGLRDFDYRPTAFGLEWMHEISDDMENSEKYLLALIRELRPDFLHFNQFYYGAIETELPRLVVAHSDVVSWWRAVHGTPPPESKWLEWYREILLRGIQAADVVVAPSRWMLAAISEIYAAPQNGAVIYNGRSPHLFNPHMSKANYALSVGRVWDSGKQVTLLCRRDLPMECYIAGSDRHPDASLRLQQVLETARLPKLHFKGEQSEAQLRHLFGRAPVYVATSRYEPFGLAPVEAALSRCALVMNDIPSFRELWGDDALYFERNSGERLVVRLKHVHENPALQREYGNRALQRAQQLFSAERMAGQYALLYENVLASRRVAA